MRKLLICMVVVIGFGMTVGIAAQERCDTIQPLIPASAQMVPPPPALTPPSEPQEGKIVIEPALKQGYWLVYCEDPAKFTMAAYPEPKYDDVRCVAREGRLIYSVRAEEKPRMVCVRRK